MKRFTIPYRDHLFWHATGVAASEDRFPFIACDGSPGVHKSVQMVNLVPRSFCLRRIFPSTICKPMSLVACIFILLTTLQRWQHYVPELFHYSGYFMDIHFKPKATAWQEHVLPCSHENPKVLQHFQWHKVQKTIGVRETWTDIWVGGKFCEGQWFSEAGFVRMGSVLDG